MSAHSKLAGLVESLFSTPYSRGEFAALALPLLAEIPPIVLGAETGRFEALRQSIYILGNNFAASMDCDRFSAPEFNDIFVTPEYSYTVGGQYSWYQEGSSLFSDTVPPYLGKLVHLMDVPEPELDYETRVVKNAWITALKEMANVLALWDAYMMHKEFFETRKGRFMCIIFEPTQLSIY